MIAEDVLLSEVPRDLFVGGTWRPAAAGATFAVDDPATGEVLREVADAGPEDGRAALAAAAAAQAAWAAVPARERGEILRAAFEELRARSEELALLITLEMGKPLAESRTEVAYAAEFFRWFAEEAPRIAGRSGRSPSGSLHILTVKQPVGPCLLITPWNFPLAMGTRKIGPAIAAGCTMVVKPAPETPLSLLVLADVLERAGLPAGVLNVVPTTRAAEVMGPLIRDPRTRKLSFTGSTEVGRLLMAQAAERVLRVSLELGGNAPFLVFADADLDAAVEGALTAKMRNLGESCVAANRIYVHASLAEEFAARLAERMGALRLGRGTEEGVDVGPLIDRAAQQRMGDLVADAGARGARTLVGGDRPDRPGWFWPPTVLDRVPPDAALLGREIFGPVAPVVAFDDEDEAVGLANDSPFGLVAYAYTESLRRALRLVERLEAGMVGINRGVVSDPAAPFGGIKQSGLGKEGGSEGIEEYLVHKYAGIGL